jgi:hypothetical protein
MFRKWLRAAVPTLAFLALTGCFLQPGTFDSSLELRKDGTFTYAYKGQIYMLALSKIAEAAAKQDAAHSKFVPHECYGEGGKVRPCTSSELADQRREWEDARQAKLKEDEKNAEAMRAMLGGIDPGDPKAAMELADRLRREAGWRHVDYVGDGLFEVDFALTSRMTHDFAFPTVEQFPMNNFFVVATRRQDSSVRIEAPGFSAQNSGNPIESMMAVLTGSLAAQSVADSATTPGAKLPQVPEMNGTFSIVTDGQILANNTDEGPKAGARGQVLQWAISARTKAAPMALVKLAP